MSFMEDWLDRNKERLEDSTPVGGWSGKRNRNIEENFARLDDPKFQEDNFAAWKAELKSETLEDRKQGYNPRDLHQAWEVFILSDWGDDE